MQAVSAALLAAAVILSAGPIAARHDDTDRIDCAVDCEFFAGVGARSRRPLLSARRASLRSLPPEKVGGVRMPHSALIIYEIEFQLKIMF